MARTESKRQDHSELFALVQAHVSSGKPFPAETAQMFDNAPPYALHQAFSLTRVHDLITTPPDDSLERLKSAEQRVRRSHDLTRLSLCWLMNGRLTRGTRAVRPSCSWFLTTLRRSWHQLLPLLPETTSRRLRQVIQVLMTPIRVRGEMCNRYAIAFSAAGRTTAVPDEPIPLSRLRAQWVFFVPGLGNELKPRLAEGQLKFMADTWALEPSHNHEYDFGLLPSRRAGRPEQLSEDQVATIENGLACHAALEFAAVTGQNIQGAATMPEAYVVVNDPTNYGNGDINLNEPSHAFEQELKDHFNYWWKFDKDPVKLREHLAPEYGSRMYPYLWIDVLEQHKNSLKCPVTSWEAARLQLGANAEAFVWGVWLAAWKPFGSRAILPVSFMPTSFGDPFRGADPYVRVPNKLRGRNVYDGGNLNVDFQATNPQVVEFVSEPQTAVAQAT